MAALDKAFGYQGDAMNLPVRDLAAALPFYETVLGFRVLSRTRDSAVLTRDQVQIRLAENGRDPSQDGCAFHVTDADGLFAEFQRNGLRKNEPAFTTEIRKGVPWKVFYVVAPDGLCYWFGEQQAAPGLSRA
jgi:catechol 2,3-dioxygenase-like lactoylglutathione lyase family enzyme